MRSVLGIIGAFRWAFPILLALIGYFIPVMHVPFGWPDSGVLWAILFFSLIAMVVWIISEIMAVVYRYTSSSELQWDDFISLTIALVATYIAGWQRTELEWWLVLPWIGAVIDGFLSGFLAINNAAQKPFAARDRDGGGSPFR